MLLLVMATWHFLMSLSRVSMQCMQSAILLWQVRPSVWLSLNDLSYHQTFLTIW